MYLGEYRNSPQLKGWVRVFPAGRYLFRQGDPGHTMFIVMNGAIEICDRSSDGEYVLATLVAGQFFGERAILKASPYPRAYAARAKTETTLLEFTRKDLPHIQAIIPDLAFRVLQIAANHLDRAHELIKALTPTDELDRLLRFLLYFSKYSETSPAGLTFSLEEIRHLIGMDPKRIEESLKQLLDKNMLIKKQHRYLIPDRESLARFVRGYAIESSKKN